MKTTTTAANSEGSLGSGDDRAAEVKKKFYGFELFAIYPRIY
jgi:hypothetical protein